MNHLRVMVVDDEPLARAGLRALLEKEPGLLLVGESAGGADAVTAIRTLRPDLVFLDIVLPDLDGFGILERLPPNERPAVVFVTAHSDQALRAFEVKALDYVTKPLRRDRVREAVARAHERIRLDRLDRAEPAPALTAPLALKTEGRMRLIEQRTIDLISADDDHVVVHAGGGVFRARDTLNAVSRRLDPTSFVRVHRSTIVRLAAIRELEPWFHGDYVLVLHSGTKVRMSRSHRPRLAAMLGRRI
ncbi:MAG: response regulator transcription factor [Gemmatimonadales bacterium]|nr:response regulator transcription factor [Gemmatimonadales bacterium]